MLMSQNVLGNGGLRSKVFIRARLGKPFPGEDANEG